MAAAFVLASVAAGGAERAGNPRGADRHLATRRLPARCSGTGEPCAASRSWRDPVARDLLDESWALTCRNVAASRPLGFVRLLGERSWTPLAAADCAPAIRATVPGVGEVEARRCLEPALGGAEVARLSQRWRGRWLSMSVSPAALGAGEAAMRRVVDPDGAAANPDMPAPASVRFAALPAWPAARGTGPRQASGDSTPPCRSRRGSISTTRDFTWRRRAC
ncbi:hypothetical protein AB5I41_09505 [Sphingomonas sp. MMS24-JH45]